MPRYKISVILSTYIYTFIHICIYYIHKYDSYLKIKIEYAAHKYIQRDTQMYTYIPSPKKVFRSDLIIMSCNLLFSMVLTALNAFEFSTLSL